MAVICVGTGFFFGDQGRLKSSCLQSYEYSEIYFNSVLSYERKRVELTKC